jgi:TnpA family transposase
LQVVENWNGANDKIFYSKDGVLTGADREHAEVSMLALHLLQSSLVYVNIQLIQAVLRDPAWAERLTAEDRRGLSPLFWTHINPYGRFYLDMNTRLDLSTA